MTSQFAPTDFPKQEYPTPEELRDRRSRYEAALRKIAFVNKSVYRPDPSEVNRVMQQKLAEWKAEGRTIPPAPPERPVAGVMYGLGDPYPETQKGGDAHGQETDEAAQER